MFFLFFRTEMFNLCVDVLYDLWNETIIFTGCEAHPDLNLSSQKYGIKLFVPGSDGMSEIWLRFESVSIL